jgi:hypothetical protein
MFAKLTWTRVDGGSPVKMLWNIKDISPFQWHLSSELGGYLLKLWLASFLLPRWKNWGIMDPWSSEHTKQVGSGNNKNRCSWSWESTACVRNVLVPILRWAFQSFNMISGSSLNMSSRDCQNIHDWIWGFSSEFLILRSGNCKCKPKKPTIEISSLDKQIIRMVQRFHVMRTSHVRYRVNCIHLAGIIPGDIQRLVIWRKPTWPWGEPGDTELGVGDGGVLVWFVD